MKRICVLGCGGAGKSHLAKRLGAALGLPVVHLDRIYWQAGWVSLSAEEFREQLGVVVAGDAWVVDGNYRSTLEERLARADTVILLDFPTWRCLWGALGRWVRQRGEIRSDMAPGCPEKFDREFLQWIWRFRRDELPGTLEALARYPHLRVHSPRDRREVERLLKECAWTRTGA